MVIIFSFYLVNSLNIACFAKPQEHNWGYNIMDKKSNTGGLHRRPLLAWPVRVYRFYRDGFREMTVGRSLWALILIKLAILFLVFRLFFFPDVLSRDYDTDEARADAVRQSLLDDSR